MKKTFTQSAQEKHFRVAIFGSARIKKGDKTYKLVYELAKKIGERSIDIVTGGGPGLMSAATEGHASGDKKHKSHSYGLLIKLPSEQKSAKHLDIKREFEHFTDRLDTFMVLSNAVVVAPGGLGTLLEFIYTWQLVQLKEICDIPIILLGEQWHELIDWIKKHPIKNRFMSPSDLNSIFFANTLEQAMNIINHTYKMYKQGDKDICLNIRKYKLR